MRQETKMEDDKWEMKAKIMSLFLTFFFLQKQKENIWEWEMITICEKT